MPVCGLWGQGVGVVKRGGAHMSRITGGMFKHCMYMD